MKQLKKPALIFLSALCGLLFLYSAYTKADPIQVFEYTIVQYAHLPWLVAAVLARALVGLEAALGLMLLLSIPGKARWIYKTAFALTAIFSIYLIYLWASFGNNVNCGCFGDAVWMSPGVSLAKNAILLAVLALLIRYHSGWQHRRILWWADVVVFVGVMLPFIILAIPTGKPDWLKNGGYHMDFSMLYAPGAQHIPATNLAKGRHVVAFLSQSCKHCRITAIKMHIMKQHDPSLPFYFIIGGESPLNNFFKATNATDIPYSRMERDTFLRYTGGIFPMIVMVQDGIVVAKTDYNTLDEATIKAWLTSPVGINQQK